MIRQNLLLLSIVLFALLCVPAAHAFGPYTHMEIMKAHIDRLHREPLPGPKGDLEILENPEFYNYALLGSIFPDILRVYITGPDVSHSKILGWYLLEQGIQSPPDQQWKTAFAVGFLSHLAGDIVAQVVLTPHYSVKAAMGEFDILTDFFDDHEGGENEVLVEGLLDVLYGDYIWMSGVLYYFVEEFSRLESVIAFVDEGLAEEHGVSSSVEQKRERNQRLREDLAWAVEHGSFIGWIDGDNRDRSYLEILFDLLRGENPPDDRDPLLQIDLEELFRLIEGPVFQDSTFFDEYFSYFQPLSVQVLRDMEPGENWFHNWPIWDAETMMTGTIQSLAHFLPQEMEPNPDHFVYRAWFEDADTGSVLEFVDAQNPPSGIRVTATVFAVRDAPAAVTLLVKKDRPGDDFAGDDIVTSAVAEMDQDPFEYSGNARLALQAEFDPSDHLDDALGFYVELVRGEASVPFFTSMWDRFYRVEGLDPFKPVYRILYSTYGRWQRTLPVENPRIHVEWGTLSGLVSDLYTGKRISGASVNVPGADAFCRCTSRGYYSIDGLSEGEYEVAAAAPGYHGAVSGPVNVARGVRAWHDLALERIISVRDEGAISPDRLSLFAQWDPLPDHEGFQGYLYCVGTEPLTCDRTGYVNNGTDRRVRHSFADDPLRDGETYYVTVRPGESWGMGSAASTDGILIDGSPPQITDLRATPPAVESTQDPVQIDFSVKEPHTPPVLLRYALGTAPGSDDLSPFASVPGDGTLIVSLDQDLAIDRYFVTVSAQNAADLAADEAVEVEVNGGSEEEEDDDADDTSCGGMF